VIQLSGADEFSGGYGLTERIGTFPPATHLLEEVQGLFPEAEFSEAQSLV
jgi:hypothetical protein